MAIKVDIGTPQIENAPEEMTVPGLDVTVPAKAPQSQMPRYAVSVGDPVIEQAMPASPNAPQEVPFSDFYLAVQGNPQIAEKILPGITSDNAVSMMRMGQDGRPTVSLTPQQIQLMQQASEKKASNAVEQKLTAILGAKRSREKADPNAPTHVEPDQFAKTLGFKSFDDIPPEALSMLLPGMDQAGGMLPYMVRTASGSAYLLNPAHPLYAKTKAEVLSKMQKKSATVALGDE